MKFFVKENEKLFYVDLERKLKMRRISHIFGIKRDVPYEKIKPHKIKRN